MAKIVFFYTYIFIYKITLLFIKLVTTSNKKNYYV